MSTDLLFDNAELTSLNQAELAETDGGIIPALIGGFILGVCLYGALTK
jgi:lactobin A/cerein 7B family class IIb bacteriocin